MSRPFDLFSTPRGGGGRSRAGKRAALVCVALAMGLVLAAPASAALYQHPFKEVFGPSEQPAFNWPKAIAVDHGSGDALVGDPAGTPNRRSPSRASPKATGSRSPTSPGACSGPSTEAIEYTTSPASAPRRSREGEAGRKVWRELLSLKPATKKEAPSSTASGSTSRTPSPKPRSRCSHAPSSRATAAAPARRKPKGRETPAASIATTPTAPRPPSPTSAPTGSTARARARARARVGPVCRSRSNATKRRRTGSSLNQDRSRSTNPADPPTVTSISRRKFHLELIHSTPSTSSPPTGRYLGQLKAGTAGTLKAVRGVAVDPSGAVYVAGTWEPSTAPIQGIGKYVPAANPPVDADSVATFPLEAGIGLAEGEVYLEPARNRARRRLFRGPAIRRRQCT